MGMRSAAGSRQSAQVSPARNPPSRTDHVLAQCSGGATPGEVTPPHAYQPLLLNWAYQVGASSDWYVLLTGTHIDGDGRTIHSSMVVGPSLRQPTKTSTSCAA